MEQFSPLDRRSHQPSEPAEITMRFLLDRGAVAELARLIPTSDEAFLVLQNLEIERGRLPRDSTNSQVYWNGVLELIDQGISPVNQPFRRLVESILDLFPGNSFFRTLASETGATGGIQLASFGQPVPDNLEPGEEWVNFSIRRWRNLERIPEAVRRATAGMLTPVRIVPGFFRGDCAVYQATGIGPDAVVQLQQNLERELRQLGENDVEVSVAAHPFRDYLIGRVLAEGPDSAQFEVTNAPASTRVGDVASSVMGEYTDAQSDSRENATVDLHTADGQTRPRAPDQTLHEAGIGENTRVHVAPERKAGVNPRFREDALARIRVEIDDFLRQHPAVRVKANARFSPTEYYLDFEAPSFGPPDSTHPPRPIDQHQVTIALPAGFPVSAPQVFWESEIYHPNIAPRTGAVCLGDLGERYQPSLNFADLFRMLMDIARYWNYTLDEPGYDAHAQDWANSEQGQLAIKERGGRSREELNPPFETESLSLNIRRRES